MSSSSSIPSHLFFYPVNATQPLVGQFCYDESDVPLSTFNTIPEGAVIYRHVHAPDARHHQKVCNYGND
ncbi:MAG: hypothetical protein IKK45_02880 [Akkermansia sp.]|nr:hypothetical protein [Akkermansia sp.]